MIEKLLLMPNNNNIKTKVKNNPNFLLFLLKTEKNPIKLLKELNFDEKEIKNLISKLPKELQNKILETKEEKKSQSFTEYKKEDEIETIFSNFPREIQHQLNSKTTQEKIVKIIKKEIEYKIKNSKISIPKKEVKELKKITNLKELVSFAKKLDLNLKKIVISKKEEITHLAKQELLDNKIPTIEILNKKSELPNFSNSKITKNLNKNEVSNLNENIPDNEPILTKLINKEKTTSKHLLKTNQQLQNKLINTTSTKLINKQTTSKNSLNQQSQNEPINTILSELINEDKTTKNLLKTNQQSKPLNAPLPDFSDKEKIKKDENKETLISMQQNINTQIHHKIISAKQTLTYFSSSLKEAIENYKPPVSKISIELNPKELGKVEVTLIHRGENLQIHINSNQTQTINFFNTNQNELKNILVNMGYSEVNMSFNSNQQQKQKDTYKQNQNTLSEKENEEFIIEIPYFYA